MSLVSLELVKKAVRADDFADDDDYLAFLTESAEEFIIRTTNRTDDELLAMGGGELPRPLVQAVMLTVGHWYNQREDASGVQMHSIPMGVTALVSQYTRLV